MFYSQSTRWWILSILVLLKAAQIQAASLRLAWDPNTEPDLAGYHVYYGVSSREYTNQIDMGNATTATISNLQYGVTYFFTCTAYNTAGLESDFSNEASTQIVQPQGNKPPTLDPLSNLVVSANAGRITVNLTGIGSGSTNEMQTITITASSSNPDVVPAPSVTYRSPESSGLLTFTTVPNAEGTAVITVTVSDGETSKGTLLRSFDVTVRRPAPLTITRSHTNIILSWPAGDFVLQFRTNVPPVGSWLNIDVTPSLNGTNYQVTEPATGQRRFYRLAHAADAQAADLLRLVLY